MKKLEKSEIYGGIGSTILLILLLLLLFIFEIKYIITKETPPELALAEIEEAFNGGGRGSEGKSGYFKPESAEVLKNSQPAAPKTAPTPPAPNFAAQDIEQNIAIQRAREEQRKKDEAERVERLRLQQEEQERQRIAAEQQAKADKARGQMSGMFGDGGKGNGSGSGTGTGNSGASGAGSGQNGNPLGKGSGDFGIGNGAGNWSLAGRDLKSSAKPEYNRNEAGIVSIEIRVDAAGKVTSAQIINRPNAKTTIEDEGIRKAALNAAYKTTFSTGGGVSIGVITYNFTLN